MALGYGVQLCQEVKLLEAHYTTMLMIVPGPRIGFIWKIESSTFDRLRDWEGSSSWDPAMKIAFAGYVFGLARACDAEGFVLKRDRDELLTYTVDQISQSMQHYDQDNPLAGAGLKGVETKYLSLEQLRRAACEGRHSKHYYTVFDRYTVGDFMFPSDAPS